VLIPNVNNWSAVVINIHSSEGRTTAIGDCGTEEQRRLTSAAQNAKLQQLATAALQSRGD